VLIVDDEGSVLFDITPCVARVDWSLAADYAGLACATVTIVPGSATADVLAAIVKFEEEAEQSADDQVTRS